MIRSIPDQGLLWRLALCASAVPSTLYLMSVWHRPGIVTFVGSVILWSSGFQRGLEQVRDRYLVMSGLALFIGWSSLVLPKLLHPLLVSFLFGFFFVLAIVFERGWREREALIQSGVIKRKAQPTPEPVPEN